jgi:hypothetical protein
MLKLLPATDSVADRELDVVFAETLKLTVPLPVPLAPVTTVTQLTLSEAVHAQPAVVVTATLPDPPAGTNAWDVGEMLYEHAVAPAWVTVNVLPATVSVPVRCELAV